jgi:UDP-N-acetylglucosamine 4,6-dehydratase/5-epimerase
MTMDGKSILITGGTGSFGRRLAQDLLENYKPERVIIFSRDELKQFEMKNSPAFQGKHSDRLRFFIGNVRDKGRLDRAFDGVDLVVHAAALKQVPSCEYNPFEAIRTNVLGAQNIIEAAIDRNVKRVIAMSTDKACNPINLYGGTKLCSDKLFVAGNSYAGSQETRFSVVRYGNVVGSRGSVIPLFMRLRESGVLPITHSDMTRFWLTLEQGVKFVIDSFGRMKGGELFVRKNPSMRIADLARAIGGDACELKVIGIRPGEKLHEVMISEDDARHTIEFPDHYVIQPEFPWWGSSAEQGGDPVDPSFRYSSDQNSEWLTRRDLVDMIPGLGA